MDKKTNFTDETKAMDSVSKAIEKLDDDAKNRVINWVSSAFKLNLQDSIPNSTGTPAAQSSPDSNTTDIKTLWKEKKPQTNYHKFALLGYYLEYIKKTGEFTKEELKQAWIETKEPLPPTDSFRVSLNDTANKYRYFLTGTKKGKYRMSNRGHDLAVKLPDPPKELLGFAKKTKSVKKNKKAK